MTSVESEPVTSAAAVIITFNRLQLLKQCVAGVRAQTRQADEIIVVNNASTDGTAEWLATQDDLTVINQENLGSAGGFHTGFLAAYDNGHDWIWCTDDDGCPDAHALHELLKGAVGNGLLMAGSLIVDRDDPSKLAYGLLLTKKVGAIRTVSEAQSLGINGVFMNYVATFNGNLVHRSVLDKIGNVKKEMFIWADDVEYLRRARCHNIPLGTVLSAFHFHPPSQFEGKKLAFGILGKMPINLGRTEYCLHRNFGYLFSLDKKYVKIVKYICKLFIFYILYKKLDIKKYFRVLRYFFDGVSGKFALPPLVAEDEDAPMGPGR